MAVTVGQYYLWRSLPCGETVQAGALAIAQDERQKLQRIEFAYSPGYLSHEQALSLDPLNAPLGSQTLVFDTSGRDLPGFIDDCLPDAWGRRVIAARLGLRHVDTLTLMENLTGATLGATQIAPIEAPAPLMKSGISLVKAKSIAESLWHADPGEIAADSDEMALLVMGGSSPGGARPKLLVTHDNKQWLAKFNQYNDTFDTVGMEWASLSLAKLAGLQVPHAQIHSIGNRRCLLVERFDVSSAGGRHPLITINALLKDKHTQEDPHLGRYEDIADISRARFCIKPRENLKQLFGQLLVNTVLKNTDDHLRNFSLIHKGDGWQLSPAYDIVPDSGTGNYHQITFNGNPFLPSIDEVTANAKVIGLQNSEANEVTMRLLDALQHWPKLLDEAGIEARWRERFCKMVAAG